MTRKSRAAPGRESDYGGREAGSLPPFVPRKPSPLASRGGTGGGEKGAPEGVYSQGVAGFVVNAEGLHLRDVETGLSAVSRPVWGSSRSPSLHLRTLH